MFTFILFYMLLIICHLCEASPLNKHFGTTGISDLWQTLSSSGVFGDTVTVKSVSVLEGDSITLYSGLTEMMDEDVILWRFGSENTLIAEINVMADSITVYDDVLDERFRDRLKVDHQTGSLTITNTRTEHTGLYQLQSNSVRKNFSLVVYGELNISFFNL